MTRCRTPFVCGLVGLCIVLCDDGRTLADGPTTFDALWGDYDPRSEPLDVKVVRAQVVDGVKLQYVTYTVGTFKGERATVAAYFASPAKGAKLPGLVHIHGGGQRASRREVLYYAKRGYACLSINWGGRPMEDAKPDDPNTDWGAVDPTQQNVKGYFNFEPGPKQLELGVSPRNNNWYLLTLAGRRGLTFLERQPNVDADRLGVYGHSMGGNLTVYVAGTDNRVKVAAPSVGGSGFRSYTWPLLSQYTPRSYGDHTELYRATMSFQAYAKHIQAPTLWLSSTNDFHGLMDDTYRTGALIPEAQVRYSIAPHLNHRFTPPFALSRPMWIDQHLRGGPKLAQTPESRLDLRNADAVPCLHVEPDRPNDVQRVAIYYSVDADPRARFWRSADVKEQNGAYRAKLPIMSDAQPLFAFANVYYRLSEPQSLPYGPPAETYAISSIMHTLTPQQLAEASMKATDKPSLVIDDFAHGWRDWYTLNRDNPHHWQFWTRKVTDPKWRGPDNAALVIKLRSREDNQLVVALVENGWRNYRGRRRDYAAVVPVKSSPDWQEVRLTPASFLDVNNDEPLKHWRQLDELGLRGLWQVKRRPGFPADAPLPTLGARWRGPAPEFALIRWTPPETPEPPASNEESAR